MEARQILIRKREMGLSIGMFLPAAKAVIGPLWPHILSCCCLFFETLALAVHMEEISAAACIL